MSLPNQPRLSDSIASKLIQGGVPVTGQTLVFNAVTNQWEFGSGGGGFWTEIARASLVVAGDVLTVSAIPARNYLQLVISTLATGGNVQANMTFNGDTAANYSRRISVNGGVDILTGNLNNLIYENPGTNSWILVKIMNLLAEEKLVELESQKVFGATPASAPLRAKMVGKWTNLVAQISSITLTNIDAGSFGIGSEIIVLGSD